MNKKSATILSICLVLLYLALCVLNVYLLFLHHYRGKVVEYNWSNEDTFDINRDSVIIYKDKDKDFTILNLADVQFADLEDYYNMFVIHSEITELVDRVKPDLITLTGDQTWSNENLLSLSMLIMWLDEYKIPYAPIFGNHDYGNDYNSAVASINKCCDIYESGKYCLFRRGPTNIGTLGNYVINIMEDDRVYKTLYMMDSGYLDSITDEQIEWFKWNAEGIRAYNGGVYSEGVLFLHKPLPEYSYAYTSWRMGLSDAEGEVYVSFSLGGSKQKGFFDIAKSMGVKDVICGHQHGNAFTINYEGVRLTFAVKTGELMSYYADDRVYLNGATSLTFSHNGDRVEQVLVDREKYHISDKFNVHK